MRFLRWATMVLAIGAAGLILAGGYFHWRDWMDLYRHLPAEVAGSAVVRIGFPINAALSVVLALCLLVSGVFTRRLLPYMVAGAILFQAGSLAALIQSRTGTIFGWSELGWTGSAGRIRAVEISALVLLGALTVLMVTARRRPRSRVMPVRVGHRRPARPGLWFSNAPE